MPSSSSSFPTIRQHPRTRLAKLPRNSTLSTTNDDTVVCAQFLDNEDTYVVGVTKQSPMRGTQITGSNFLQDTSTKRRVVAADEFICYGLNSGLIRVRSENGFRILLKGSTKMVTDLELIQDNHLLDTHYLAAASTDGCFSVWNLSQGSDEQGKPQISGKIVIAIQIIGEGESVHPRVCWHCHKQEVLVVGIGKHVLKIDTTKVGRGEKISAEEPLICSVEKLIDGAQLIGSHDGDVTDLSMCHRKTTRLVSSSVDGTIKIWTEENSLPVAVIYPYLGEPVNSVTFLAAPNRPHQAILTTGGALNNVVKILISSNVKGTESWDVEQVLELDTTEKGPCEITNHVVVSPKGDLFLLGDATRNSVFAVHFEWGTSSARMDYILELSTNEKPREGILSLDGVLEVNGDCQIYSMELKTITKYVFRFSLPPTPEDIFVPDPRVDVVPDPSSPVFEMKKQHCVVHDIRYADDEVCPRC